MVPHSVPPAHHTWIYRRGVLPILALLRMGATPRSLAWSIAAGALIGINPVIGSTTLLCLAIAFQFRLNVVASQIANHAMFPLNLRWWCRSSGWVRGSSTPRPCRLRHACFYRRRAPFRSP